MTCRYYIYHHLAYVSASIPLSVQEPKRSASQTGTCRPLSIGWECRAKVQLLPSCSTCCHQEEEPQATQRIAAPLWLPGPPCLSKAQGLLPGLRTGLGSKERVAPTAEPVNHIRQATPCSAASTPSPKLPGWLLMHLQCCTLPKHGRLHPRHGALVVVAFGGSRLEAAAVAAASR